MHLVVLSAVLGDRGAELVRLGVPAFLVEGFDAVGEGGEDVVDALALRFWGEDAGEGLVGDGLREWGGDGDWAVKGEEGGCCDFWDMLAF